MEDILEILEKNARIPVEDIAIMIGKDKKTVEEMIKKYEKEKIILSYNTIINWEKTDKEKVTALIEVKVTPKRGKGFDEVAKKIYSFPEVKDCYLMSGGFDLTVIIEGKTMKEVAYFVAEKLAPIDSVLSTATHFVLKKYKDKGIVFDEVAKDDREYNEL